MIGKKIGDKVEGKDISGELSGYELEIKGTSDSAGFPGKSDIEGSALRKILLTKGPFLKRVPHKGFRRKKTVRGNQISIKTVQVNTFVAKQVGEKLDEIFVKEEKKD